jgi:hypothetical protein
VQIVNQLPCWYVLSGLVWSTYQGFRGIVEQRRAYKDRNEQDRKWSRSERVIILYIHDFAFRFICTTAGFLALYVAYFLAKGLAYDTELATGSSLLLTLSFLIGVIGVGGQLHYVILMGRWPSR